MGFKVQADSLECDGTDHSLGEVLGTTLSAFIVSENSGSDAELGTMSTHDAVQRLHTSLVDTSYAWLLPLNAESTFVESTNDSSDSDTQCEPKCETKLCQKEAPMGTTSDSQDPFWERYPPAQTRFFWEARTYH